MTLIAPKNSALVMGGGVIGFFVASALQDQGMNVTVIEAATAGRSASWAAGGILSPLPPWQADAEVWALAQESIERYPALCAGLHARTGIDPQWTPSGLWVADADDDADDGRDAWLRAQGLPAQPQTVRVNGEPQGGCLLPWVAQLRSPRLMRALIADFTARGGLLLQQQGAVQWQLVGTAVQAVVTAGGHCHRAEHYVLAAGAWSAGLAAQLGIESPVRPVRGQMLLIRAGAAALQQVLLMGDRYLIPRRDGRIVVGSTVEHTGFDAHTTQEAHDGLLRFAQQLFPTVTAKDIEAQWAGLRPMAAPNGVPLIGRLGRLENAWQCTGHYRNGITLAPASGERLTQQILRR